MKLYSHQQDLLDINPARHLLAWQCGSGKSLAAIELVKKNKQKALVVCPKSIKHNWIDQVSSGWQVVTKEELRRDWDNLPGYNAIIVDECHYFSGPKSQMFKSAMKYFKKHKPQYIYLLTATPYMSTPWNLHTLARLLGHAWHYTKFRDTYFSQVRMGPRLVPVIKQKIPILARDGLTIKGHTTVQEEMARLTKLIGNTVRMDECVDVPLQTYLKEDFELTSEQNKAVKEIEEDVLANFIVKWTKKHQICGGALKGDGYVEDQFFKSEKLNRLLDLVGEHPLLTVVCRYNNEVKMLAQSIQKKYPKKEIYEMTGAKKEAALAASSDDCVLIANAAVSEGWEFPKCPVMIFYSYDFSLKNYVQMRGRIQRINNIKKNVYLSLIVPGTIDEDVYKCIQKKKDFDLAIYEEGRLRL